MPAVLRVELERLGKRQFIDDLWFLVRRLRDMKDGAGKHGVGAQIKSARSVLAEALGRLESSGCKKRD